MKKVRVHPLFLALLLALIVWGKWLILCSAIFAVIIHEYFHYLAAKIKGYRLIQLTFMPYGAVLSSKEHIMPDDETFIAAAGPLSNLVIVIVIIALWWLYPAVYVYTLDFFKANLAIGAFNVLPAYPLDGARIALSLSKNRNRTMKILKIIGIVISFLLMAAFVASAFFDINYTLGIASVFLFAGSISGNQKENYIHLCNQVSYLKDFNRPLEKKHIIINSDVAIKNIVKMLRPYAIFKVEVVDKSLNTVAIIKEQQLEEIFLTMKGNTTVGDAIERLNDKKAEEN